jgi:hypothetical protein
MFSPQKGSSPRSPKVKNDKSDPLAEEIASIDRIGERMDNIMRGWMPEEDIQSLKRRTILEHHNEEIGDATNVGAYMNRDEPGPNHSRSQVPIPNLARPEVKRMPSIKKTPVNLGRPNVKPALGVGGMGKNESNSGAKLKVISDGFRQILNPFSKLNARDLIKTPNDDIVDKLNFQHKESVERRDQESVSFERGTGNIDGNHIGSNASGRSPFQIHKVPSAPVPYNPNNKV